MLDFADCLKTLVSRLLRHPFSFRLGCRYAAPFYSDDTSTDGAEAGCATTVDNAQTKSPVTSTSLVLASVLGFVYLQHV